jgi:ABC-type Na+ efflux pump permease subunit
MNPQAEKGLQLPHFDEERSTLQGGLDTRSLIVTALVLFSIFFVCVYLLSSLTCEERERGVLLAQALSPASLGEILLAKFLFYPLTAMGLAALLTGILVPGVLGRSLFWLILAVASFGSLGIGLTIASLARTQRAASMGAMCYMMAVTMLLFLCQQTGIPGISNLALEYHCPRILQAVVANAVIWYHWAHLGGAVIIALAWSISAIVLFRRYGWQ